jgi:FtsH-binding integral membrane protein
VEATSIRPGYELWRPNRERNDAKATKVLVAIVLLVSAALLIVITLGGWERLQGASVGAVTLAWAALYVLFAFLVIRWQRGILPVAAALAVLMLIFAAVSAPGWFARDKDGLTSPALPEELVGLLVVIVIPVQIVLIAVAMFAFNQNWHVEEERPIGGGERPHDEDDYPDRSPQPA